MLICQNSVTYSAYGEGEKPRIYGSPENGSGAEKWKLLDGTTNIWVFYKDMQDCGGILLDNTKVADKYCAYWDGMRYMDLGDTPLLGDYSSETLRNAKPFDVKTLGKLRFFNDIQYSGEGYYSRSGKLYLRCDTGNPGTVYDSIEFITGFANDESCQALVWLAPGSIVDNLCLKFGVSGVYMGDQSYTNEILQNCEIGYVGGTMWMGYTGHNFGGSDFGGLIIRSGDGVLMGGSNNKCISNCIYQVWDNAVTVEQSGEKDQLIENNYIEYCYGGLMTGGWNMVETDGAQYENITFANNYVMWMGKFNNWSHHYDGTDNSGAQILISNNPGNRNINYINNVFYESLGNAIVTYHNYDPGQPVTFSGNTYIQLNGGKLIYYEHYIKNTSGKYELPSAQLYFYNDSASKTIANILGDNTAVVLPMSLPLPPSTAHFNSQTVAIEGRTSVKFQLYSINGNNYIMLRDIAKALDGTASQFDVDYVNGKVTITIGVRYTHQSGNELKPLKGYDCPAVKGASSVVINGKEVALTAYSFNGSNYFQLREVLNALDAAGLPTDVDWSAKTGITIQPGEKYTAN